MYHLRAETRSVETQVSYSLTLKLNKNVKIKKVE